MCPFLVPVIADRLWLYPVSAYCRRPDGPIRVPAPATMARFCTGADHGRCPGFHAELHPPAPAPPGGRV